MKCFNQCRLASVMAAFLLVFPSMHSAYAGEWRFPVGLSLVNDFSALTDTYEDNLEYEGYDVDGVTGLPVGVAFRPYYEWDSGLGLGASVGPMMLVIGDADFFSLPTSLDVRYSLRSASGTAPYIRAGFLTLNASGDYVADDSGAAVFALGVEFLTNRVVGWGIEFATTSASITLEDYSQGWFSSRKGEREIEPLGSSLSVFAVF